MNQFARFQVGKAEFYRFVAEHDDKRFEYEDGFIVQQMTGGTRKHQSIAQSFLVFLLAHLDRSRWDVFIERGLDTGPTVRYADVVVEPATEPGSSLSTEQPALAVEVLSPSSHARDLRSKPAEYLGVATLQAYIVASQDEALCLAWVRGTEGDFPGEPAGLHAGDAIEVPGLDLTIPVSKIYGGLDLREGER